MIKSGILAIQFLTRIPLNIAVDFNDKNLGRSTFFFPFVGNLLGFMAYVVYSIFSFWGRDIGSVFTVLSLVVFTGGLHLDGLSDSCDGFFSNRDRDGILEIMRDSRVGAFGVVGLIIVILMKYVLISNIGLYPGRILTLSLGNSRLVQAYIIACKEPAREEGLGAMFGRSNPVRYVIVSGIIYIFILVFMDSRYLLPLLINFFIGELLYGYSQKKIGGFTGDVLGAIAEIGELSSLLGFIGVMEWI